MPPLATLPPPPDMVPLVSMRPPCSLWKLMSRRCFVSKSGRKNMGKPVGRKKPKKKHFVGLFLLGGKKVGVCILTGKLLAFFGAQPHWLGCFLTFSDQAKVNPQKPRKNWWFSAAIDLPRSVTTRCRVFPWRPIRVACSKSLATNLSGVLMSHAATHQSATSRQVANNEAKH